MVQTDKRKALQGDYKQLRADNWKDYQLLDSGHGRKLERYGDFTVDRPDAQAMWEPSNPVDNWKADGVFTGNDDEDRGAWKFPGKGLPDKWPMNWKGLTLEARCASFRHMGLFPEHSVHWEWATNKIKAAGRPIRVLNLFGYTGVMSLACAQAGAEVVHLDASPKSIGFGRENQTLSNLDDRTIRWICDDAIKFMRREERRGRTYDGIILDPPKYGRGPKKEIWQLDQGMDELLSLTRNLLSPDPLFVILTVYAVRLSFIAVGQTLAQKLNEFGGSMEWGEMTIPEANRNIDLPTAVYARWSK